MNSDTNGTATVVEMPQEEANPFAQRVTVTTEVTKATKKISLLSRVTTRKRRRPMFGLLYGPPGVGKSTFGSQLPDPLMIGVERGLDQINVAKLDDPPKTFSEFYGWLEWLAREEHPYKSIVIDTADALELLMFKRIIEEGGPGCGPNCKTLEAYGGGYNKWISRERELWTGVIGLLTEMSEKFNILLIAHSQVKNQIDPVLIGTYDQHQIKIQEKSAAVIKQAVDLIIFANLDVTFSKDSQKARKGRGIVSGDRVMYTQPITGVEAKNRFNLESPMEFSWAALNDGIENFYSK
jgi:hypothetical protein